MSPPTGEKNGGKEKNYHEKRKGLIIISNEMFER